MGERDFDREIDELFKKIVDNVGTIDEDNEYDGIDDCFNEYILSSVSHGYKGGKKISYFPCDTCGRKKAIIEKYNRVCNKEYIPPYVDRDCRDYKIALVVEKIDECIVEKVFRYLIFRISIQEIVSVIDDPEWRKQAEAILRSKGYGNFIESSFGKFNKKQIIQMIFDVNFCYFDAYYKRNLKDYECIDMVKYYIVQFIRDRLKESLFKIAQLIELELEYKIAVIESEIRYLIKCILQEIMITPLPAANYNINYFNKIGSLTELLKIFDGAEGGRHDERSDFRHIRDTVRKYEKVIRTTLDLLNKKIKEYECLISQRRFIVGVTGICEKSSIFPGEIGGNENIVVPPKPVIVLNPPDRRKSNSIEDPSADDK